MTPAGRKKLHDKPAVKAAIEVMVGRLWAAEQWLRRGELTTAETRAHEGHLFRLSRRLLHEVALWRVGAPRCSTCKRDHHPKDPCQD